MTSSTFPSLLWGRSAPWRRGSPASRGTSFPSDVPHESCPRTEGGGGVRVAFALIPSGGGRAPDVGERCRLPCGGGRVRRGARGGSGPRGASRPRNQRQSQRNQDGCHRWCRMKNRTIPDVVVTGRPSDCPRPDPCFHMGSLRPSFCRWTQKHVARWRHDGYSKRGRTTTTTKGRLFNL